MNPYFSIITVNLNNLSGLKKTLQSVRLQTYRDFEWIVVDGLSSDGSLELIKNEQIHAIIESDNGIFDAMNKGIARAKGEWILMLNSGDSFVSSNLLEQVKQLMLSSPVQKLSSRGLTAGSSVLKSQKTLDPAVKPRDDNNLKPRDDNYQDKKIDIYFGNAIYTLDGKILDWKWPVDQHPCHQAMFVHRSIYEKLQYDPSFKLAGDYKFYIQSKQFAAYHYLPLDICYFELEGVGSSSLSLKVNLHKAAEKTAADGHALKNIIRAYLTFILRKFLGRDRFYSWMRWNQNRRSPL